jgi:hypothetical protein
MPLFILRPAYPTADSFEVRRAFKDVFKKFNRVAAFAVISWRFAAQAFAQLEVSPDHFDAPVSHVPKKVPLAKAHKTTAAKRHPSGMGSSRKHLSEQRKSAQGVSTESKTKAPASRVADGNRHRKEG